MSVRRSSLVLAGIGVVLVVLGVLVRFVVVPVATKLPGSTSLGVTYSGQVPSRRRHMVIVLCVGTCQRLAHGSRGSSPVRTRITSG